MAPDRTVRHNGSTMTEPTPPPDRAPEPSASSPLPVTPELAPEPAPAPAQQSPALPPPPPAFQPVGAAEPPQPTSGRGLVLAAVVLVVVVLLGALGVLLAARQGSGSASGGADTAIPTATSLATGGPTPASGATSGAPSPSPSGEASPGPSGEASPGASTGAGATAAIDAQVATVEAQVPPIRGLNPRSAVPTRVIGEAQLRDEYTRQFDQQNPPADLAKQQAMLEHLGFVPPGTDIRALLLEANGTGISGFYDDQTKQMTVVQRGDFGPVQQITIAHEFTHALQDQNFGLKSLGTDDRTNGDRAAARLALVEGDATLLMTLWAQQHIPTDQLIQALQEAASDPAANAALAKLPPILREALSFPYGSGLTFVLQEYLQGGWKAVDAAYGKPPNSTAQILHPDKYRAGLEPVQVTLPPIAQRLGAGWAEQLTDTLGELDLRIWLQQALPQAEAESVAAGWAGDRMGSYAGPDGAWGVAWEIAADNTGDAAKIAQGAEAVAAKLGSAKVVPGRDANHVRVLVASDGSTLSHLQAAAAP
jgi:hypothetical protein